MTKTLEFRRLGPAIFFALLPAAAVTGGLALPPLAGQSGLAALDPSNLRAAALRNRTFLILLGIFIGWCVLSTAWSPNPDHRQALRLAATVLGGLLFVAACGRDARSRGLTEAAGGAALLVTAAFLCVEAFMNMPFTRAGQPHEIREWVLQRNPGRAASLLIVFGWAVLAGWLGRGGPWRWMLAILLVAASGVLATQFDMQANIVAFGLGLVAFALGFAVPRIGVIAVSSIAAIWLAASPFLTPLLTRNSALIDQLPFSWAMRTQVWDFAAARIQERPWFGRGLDASRMFPDTIIVRGQTTHAIPLHPHSASLQIWLETGAIGAGLGVMTLLVGGFAMARAFRANRLAAGAVCATLASVAVIANVSFGAWQEWWDATAFVAAALIASLPTSAKA